MARYIHCICGNTSIKAKREAIKEKGKDKIGLSGIFLENNEGKFEERNKEKAEKALMRNESRNVNQTFQENRKVRVNESFLDKT